MNPKKKIDRERLFKSMEWSRRALRPFRENRLDMIQQYVGSKYGDNGPTHEVLVNMLFQTADIYTLSLAANRPRVLINAKRKELWPFAGNYQVALNNLICEIQLEETMRAAVLDAFFCIGIVKVSRGDSVPVQLEGWPLIDPGYPFAENVSLDNWVHDQAKAEWWKIDYAGDMYRVSFESVKNDERFDKKVKDKLVPTTKNPNNPEGDQRAEKISQGLEVDQDEFEPMIDLLDVWMPQEQRIDTYACNAEMRFNSDLEPLASMDWDGPEEGPYHILSFSDVPDNIMPVSPAANLEALHRLSNSLMRKLARQAKNQKTLLGYEQGSEDDASRIKDGKDMQTVKLKNKDAFKVMSFNGADPGLQASFMHAMQLFSRQAGNLDAFAGLGPQSDTATQDSLIHQAVSKKEAKMQFRVVDFAAKISRDLGFLLWDDKLMSIPGEQKIPGTDISVPSNWEPDNREGSFLDYSFDVVPYSMAYQSPSEQMQGMLNFVMQIVLPMSQTPWGQQAGLGVDVQELTRQFSELMNLPRLDRILSFSGPPQDAQPSAESPRPAVTRRENVRRSIPGGDSPEMQMQELQTQARSNQQGMMVQ